MPLGGYVSRKLPALAIAVAAAWSSSVCRAQPLPFLSAATGKFGYVDKSGHVTIKATFDNAEDFFDGLAATQTGSQCQYIDGKGNIVLIVPCHDRLEPFSDGLVQKWIDDAHYGYIDRTGVMKIQPRFGFGGSWMSWGSRRFVNGRARVTLNDKWGYIDRSGNLAIPANFDTAEEFSDGFATVSINYKSGVINKDGRYIFTPRFDYVGKYLGNTAVFEENGKFGFIDGNGNIIIDAKFAGADNFSGGIAPVSVETTSDPNQKLWGYIDREGKFVITPQYAQARSFSEGRAAVRPANSDLWGYIDENGVMKITPQFKEAGAFTQGTADVEYPDIYTRDGKAIPRSKITIMDKFTGTTQLTRTHGYIDVNGDKIMTWSESSTDTPDFCDTYRCAGGSLVNFGDPPQVKVDLRSTPSGANVFAVPYIAYDNDKSLISDPQKLDAFIIPDGKTNLETKLFSQRYLIVFERDNKKILREVPVFPGGNTRVTVDFGAVSGMQK
jgi:hypothetical protein